MNAHRPAAFAVFAAFATLAALMPLASAQIVAYKAAPASQQPTVLTAGNGVPLINIQTPSAAGVSRNTYSQFDVDPNGVILNNARNNALTQLGGWVQGNPWLAHGSARVILNEVVAANPSQLLGYVEIAGSAAQVVIANPAGLTCNGCGFINASRATLTTGTPLVNGGNLESYRVEGGTLRIEGTGLDASRVGYTDLIARAVEVNAGLWAQTLKVTTGSNVVDAGNTQATPISGSGPAPAFAIDVASLGGLYAGKITLVGTEAGVGVRNAGTLGASVGEVTVTVDGRLQNSGSLMARGDIALNTPGELHNTGLVSAGGTLAITADRVINADTLGASQGLEGQALTINADTVDNHSGALRADTALSISSSGSLDNRAGLIASAQTLSILDPKASKTLAIANTAGTLIAGQRLDIDSASLSGDGKLLSQGDLAIKLVADFTHAGGFAELTANGRATLETAGTLTNQATMQGGTALTLRAASIDNQAAGEILAPELALTASETHSLTNRGLIDGGDTRIDAVTLNNLGTGRLYGDHLSIAATTLNNEAEGAAAPVIVARDRLDLAVGTLNNRDEAVLFGAGDLAIGGSLDSARRATGRAGDINNVSATLEALGELSIQAATVNNKRRSLAIERELKDSASRSYTRCEDPPDCDYIDYLTETTTHAQDEVTSTSPAASILAGKTLRITADTLTNEYASIQAGGDLTLLGSSLANTGAELFLQTDVATSGYWRHWGRSPHALPTTYSSTAVKTGSVDAVISAGGDLTGSFTDRIDSLTIRQHAAPVLAGSGTGTRSGASIAPVGDTLPASRLFRPNPNPDGRYLIETDPRFADFRQWLGSDYLLAQLQLDPAITQKRLGDGFYEQRLIDEQVGQLTGRRFLVGYQNEEDQYRALMDAGVTVARQWKLIPGVALSAAQMAALTTDIVWLVEKVVAGQKVLVPQVYARVQPGDLAPSGAVLGGNNVRLDVAGELATSGTVAGRQLVTLDAERLQNLRGHIQGADVEVRAQTDLISRGGTFTARDRLAVSAGRDLSIESSTVDQHYRQAGRVAGAVDKTVVDRVAGLYVAGDAGVLLASAGRDLKLLGAAVANTGSAGSTLLAAGHDLTLGTVSESSQAATTAKKGYWRENRRTEVGSTLQTSGDLTLVAGNDLTARAANVSSDQGALLASAGNDLKIDAGQARTATETYAKSSKRGLLGSSSTVRRDTVEDGTALASTFSGDSTTLIATRDLSIKGSNVVATKDTTLSAGRDLALEAATQTHNETHYSKTKQSGVFGSGGIGFTIGSRQNSTDQKTDATLAAQSTVGSTAGNVLLLAGENYRQVGSDVIAVQGDVNVAAKRVDIVEARQTSRTVTETKSKQSGLTLAVSSPVISAIQTVQQMSQAAADTQDPRMKLLAAASTGLSANNAVDALKAGQGKTVQLPDGTVKDNQMPVLDESGKTIGSRDPNAADQVGGINVSLSIGSSKSRSKSIQTSDTAAVSNLTAGRDLRIEARGAGADSDITLQGAQAKASRNLTLTADDEIKLLAARNTAEQHSTNQNRSASVGIGFALGGTQNGFTLQAGVSGGRGSADGQDVSYTHTHVEAGNTLSLQSGGDTTLKGAVARGEQVIANVGKDLTIESLQDLSTYDSKQKSLGASVSLCIFPFCVGATPVSGSVSASASKVNSDYASVTEQSALRAGGGGFDVKVKNDTDLKGGAITSTQQAIDDNKNSFHTGGELTTRDLQNQADYTAKSASINIGTGFSAAGALVPQGTSMGFGKDSGSASSTTRAAISGIAGNTNARTGDKETGVAKIFDAAKVQKEIEAQTKITQMFGQLASKAVGDFAVSRSNVLKDQARQEGDSDKRAALYAEARLWDDGGAYRVALHAAIGGLAGGTPGALGAGATAVAAPLLNELQDHIAKSLKEAGVNETVAKAAGQLISGATAAGIGALASGGSTAGAATGLNVDANNRQLHITEKAMLAAAAKALAAKATAGRELTPEQLKQFENYWFDQLRAEASANVDPIAAKNRQESLDQVAATNQAGYVGLLGAGNYLNDAQTARAVVASVAGMPILGTDGKPTIADGAALLTFQATNTQYIDSKLFLANDTATLVRQFGSIEAANAASIGASRSANISDVISSNYRNSGLLAAYRVPSEGLGLNTTDLDLATLGLAGLIKSSVKSALEIAGNAVERRLAQAAVNSRATSVVRSGDTADAGSVVTSGSNGTIFSGHGSYELGSGITVVPEGTSLTVYSKFGATITDRLGNVVETGGDLSSVYSRTYVAGERLPNYTLHAPDGLAIKGSPVTVSTPTLISDLLKPSMGECQWAACTYNWRASNASTVFDTLGIGNNQTKQWVTIYSKDGKP